MWIPCGIGVQNIIHSGFRGLLLSKAIALLLGLPVLRSARRSETEERLHWKGSPHSGSFRPLLPCVSASGEVGVILGCGKLRSPSHRTAPLRQVSIPNSASSLGLLGNPSFPGSPYPVPGSGRTNVLDRPLPSPDPPHLRPQGHPAAHFFKDLPLSSLFWSCSVLFYHSLPPEAAPKAPSCLDPPPILLA